MAMRANPDKQAPERPKRRAPKGKARFEVADDGKAIAVHLDRQGFRRLLETLERLAATGERQAFEKSGRGGHGGMMEKLVFHIDRQSR
ncbi:MAG: hypothetical protein OEU92_13510 [Alphaproteobacteria bacterium]|nr:hypothetical protein [Alphaproteobacteria bacterium]